MKKFNYRDASEQKYWTMCCNPHTKPYKRLRHTTLDKGKEMFVKRISDARDKAKIVRLQLKIEGIPPMKLMVEIPTSMVSKD